MHQRPQHCPLNRPRMPRTKSRPILRHPHTRHPRHPAPRNRPIRPTPLHLSLLECGSSASAFRHSTQPPKQTIATNSYVPELALRARCYLFAVRSLPPLHHHAKAARRTRRDPRSSSRSVDKSPHPLFSSSEPQRTQRLLCDLCVSLSLFLPKTKKPRQLAEASYTSLRCKVYHFFKYCQGKSCYPLKLFCSPHSPALSPKLGTYPQSPNKLLRPPQKFHLSFP